MYGNDSKFDDNAYYGEVSNLDSTNPTDFPESAGCELDLSNLDADFDEAEVEEEEEYQVIPDGKYQVEVSHVELRRTKNTGDPSLAWEMRVIGGEHAGRKLWRNNVLKTKENMRWFKKDLRKCGVELPKLSALPLHLDKLIGVRLEIKKSSHGKYFNVYLNKKLIAPPQPRGDVPY